MSGLGDWRSAVLLLVCGMPDTAALARLALHPIFLRLEAMVEESRRLRVEGRAPEGVGQDIGNTLGSGHR